MKADGPILRVASELNAVSIKKRGSGGKFIHWKHRRIHPRSLEGVQDSAFFNLELGFVGKVLPGTASAFSKNRAKGFDPLRGGFDDFDQFALRIGFLFFNDPDGGHISWRGERNEHDFTRIDSGNTGSSTRDIMNGDN